MREPKHQDAPYDGPRRMWTEITIDTSDLMALLTMPEGTRLVSMRCNSITDEVIITVEEPPEA